MAYRSVRVLPLRKNLRFMQISRSAAELEAWAGVGAAGLPWPHEVSATAITASGSRHARARRAPRDSRIPMKHSMLGHDDGNVKGA